jgi:enterochelin esterase family protein
MYLRLWFIYHRATISQRKIPVFYLISGTTDTEETFFKVGRVNFILDNLIAQGKAKI